MVVTCPHCQKQLKLNEKVWANINKLEPGRKIKVKCVHCSAPLGLERDSGGGNGAVRAVPIETSLAGVGGKMTSKVRPPSPPAIDWLQDGVFEDKDIVEDIPRALVLFPEMESRKIIVKAAEDFGYLVEQVNTPEEAIDKMRFVNYAAVFLHDQYESGGIEESKFHQYMKRMAMAKRRYIFYILIGEQFRTLYDLEALSYSVNLVVNDNETKYINTLLRKTIPEYEELFGPIMEEIRIAGK